MYRIQLSDGTMLDNLGLNGNNFISTTEITKEDFEGKMSPVKITNLDDGSEEVHEHMKLVQIVKADYTNGDWYFVIDDISEEELWRAYVMGNIEYLAMMSDIEL